MYHPVALQLVRVESEGAASVCAELKQVTGYTLINIFAALPRSNSSICQNCMRLSMTRGHTEMLLKCRRPNLDKSQIVSARYLSMIQIPVDIQNVIETLPVPEKEVN